MVTRTLNAASTTTLIARGQALARVQRERFAARKEFFARSQRRDFSPTQSDPLLAFARRISADRLGNFNSVT